MVKKRPQLDHEDLLRLKWLLGGLLVLLAVSSVFYLDIEAWGLMALTAVAVTAGLVRPAWPARLPALVHRLAFPAIVAFFIGDIYLTTELLPALVRLDILLLLYRGITYRRRREDLQLIVLGLFLVVLAGVLTVSLWFALQILVFSASALTYLLVITLVDTGPPTREQPAGEVPVWTHGSWWPFLRRVRLATDWRIVVLGGGLFGGLVVVSALLFLAIPRVELQNSLFLERFITKKARTGFTDSIRFGDVTDIQQDNRVAVSIDVTDPAQIPASPYWRMVVLDDYREETFRLSPELRQTAFGRERSAAGLRGSARPRLGPPVYWTFYVEAGVSRYLPLGGAFEILRFWERQNFREARELGVVALRDEPVSMTAYRVEGMQPAGMMPDAEFGRRWEAARSEGRTDNLTQLRLNLSETDRQRLRQIVTEIGGVGAAPADFAQRASRWLAARHGYGLQSRTPPGGGDPLVRWLISTEPGHCELFAGALVLLARAAGLPARVVTGFRGGSWNGFSNNLTLRNSDAHAWVEIFDEAGQGWRRVDPTPGSPVLADDAPGLAAARLGERADRSWSARLDSLRIFWYRRIVSFDQQSQVETLKAVKTATQETGRRIRAWLDETAAQVKAWLSAPWNLRRLLPGLLTAPALAILVWWSRRLMRQRWRLRRPRGGRLHPVRVEAGRWLTRLRGSGPDVALVTELQRLRFGAEGGWTAPAGVFRKARRAWRELRRGRISSP